jgi:dihydrofolate synthase/folylpolyglutamate synthase
VDPLISVITDISLDHQKYLGNTIGEIACEKGGIIREKGVVVTLPQHPEANEVIGNIVLERNAAGVSAVKYTPPVSPGAAQFLTAQVSPMFGRNRYPLTVMGEQILVDSPLVGRHQYRNIALAITTAEELSKFGFKITPKQIEQGIRETHWPGRFQVVPPSLATCNHTVVLDVAHNAAGAWALRSALSESFPDNQFTLVFAVMRDKAIQEMAEVLFPIAQQVIVTHVNNPRAASTEELVQAGSRTGSEITAESELSAALRRALEQAPAGSIIVITGSIFLVGDTMKEFGIPA